MSKLNSRKKITPVLPTSATTLHEDSINPNNDGLYENLAGHKEYWTYDRIKQEIVVMEIDKETKILRVIRDVSEHLWEFFKHLMKEVVPPKSEDTPAEEILGEAAEKRTYSRVYRSKASGRRYRYNYSNSSLELLDPEDDSVVDSQGLSKGDFEDNPEYWIDYYDHDIETTVDASWI